MRNMAGDPRETRQRMKPADRHRHDDFATSDRHWADLQAFVHEGGNPGGDPDAFFRFRIKRRGWGGRGDGTDRYPEHT